MFKRNSLKKYFVLILMFFTVVIGFSSWIIVGENKTQVGKTPSTRAVAYIVDSNGTKSSNYTSIEGALIKAKSGDTVHVIVNKTNPAIINYDCTVKNGVTLNIPYKEGEVQSNGEAALYGASYTYLSTNVTNIVKINKNATLSIENGGLLVIGGVLSGGNGGHAYAGQTAGEFAKLVLMQNAKIESYGTIRCCGYIIEETSNNSSKVINHNGASLYLPFILRDFRGGSTMTAIWKVVDTYMLSPFNQFEFRNITSKNIYEYGSKLYGYVNLYASSSNHPATINFLGNDSTFFIQLTNSVSYVECKYNTNEINNVDFYGGAKLNTMKMDAAGTEVDTVKVYFPLTWRFNVTLNKGNSSSEVVYDMTSQKAKFMTGFSMIVNEGCELKSTNIISYSCYYDKTNAHTGSNIGGQIYANKGPANFEVYGKYMLDENSSFAGTIIKGSGNLLSSNIVNGNSITLYEALIQSGTSYFTSIDNWVEIKEKTFIVESSDLSTKTIFTVGVTKWTGTYTTPSFQIPEIQSGDILETNTMLLNKNFVINPILNTNIRTANYNNAYYQKDSTQTLTGKLCYFTIVPSTSETGNVDTSKVTISSSNISITDGVGKTSPSSKGKLVATAYNESNIVSYTARFYWTSSDTTIATVDQNGNIVSTSKSGKTTITATSLDAEKISASIVLEVLDPSLVTQATLSADNVTSGSNAAMTSTITLAIAPSTAVGYSIEWTFESNGAGASFSSKSDTQAVVSVPKAGVYGTKTTVVLVTVTNSDGTKVYGRITLTAKAYIN